jgi:hypothetical protein
LKRTTSSRRKSLNRLNVHRYELDSGQFGQSTETYHVAHFLLDNDDNIKSRLITKMRSPSGYFPALYLLRRSHLSEQYPEWVREELFYKARLFSLEPDHRGVAYTPAPWGPGWTLGIGCHKKDNPHIIRRRDTKQRQLGYCWPSGQLPRKQLAPASRCQGQ